MGDHDPLCWYDPTKQSFSCCCALIAKVGYRERERITHNVTAEWAEAVHDYRADLRAKVRGMWLTSDTDHDYNDGYEAAKREFLDILDGSSDG